MLTFKSIEAKRAWQAQDSLTTIFGAIAKATKTTLDIIAFGFLKGAINSITASECLEALISQNPNYISSLY